MTRIAIIAGSTRPGRKALDVAAWVHEHAARRGDAAYEVVDLRDHALPLLDEPVPPAAGAYAHAHTRAWARRVAPFDGYVFVTPEYNRAPSAALKNAIDYLHAEWQDKAAAFVGYGNAGGARAMEQLRLVLGDLGLAVVPEQVGLSVFADFADFTELRPQAHRAPALGAMLDRLVPWARAMAAVRAERRTPQRRRGTDRGRDRGDARRAAGGGRRASLP